MPFFVLVAMAVPATVVLHDMEDFAHADVTIKVTGYQWKWRYEYLDQGIEFFSNLATPPRQIYGQTSKARWYLREVDEPLVVPVGQKIRFLVTSNDVIHSWWMPELGIKRDAIPGFMHESWARINLRQFARGTRHRRSHLIKNDGPRARRPLIDCQYQRHIVPPCQVFTHLAVYRNRMPQ